jgi:hypothetical protein
MEWITIIALVLGPVVAVAIGQRLQDRKADTDRKFWILSQLWGGRHAPVTPEFVRALNSVDVVFRNDSQVRKLWREFFEMLCDPNLTNPTGFTQREKKKREMLVEMARVLGLGDEVKEIDADRIYIPEWLGKQDETLREIQKEWLRVLKATPSFPVNPAPAKRPNT